MIGKKNCLSFEDIHSDGQPHHTSRRMEIQRSGFVRNDQVSSPMGNLRSIKEQSENERQSNLYRDLTKWFDNWHRRTRLDKHK